LRKKCVGKLVSFQVEYKNAQSGRDYGSVFLDGENLGEAILKQGLAKFKASKKESEEYKDLSDAQQHAINNKLGLWAEPKPKEREIIWSGFDADALLKSFKNKPVNVIVEYVMNGSSLRVQLPTGEMVVLQLTGVQCPGLKGVEEKSQSDSGKKKIEIGQQWSKEARHYTELRILHRDVTVLFEGVDKGESLLGTILISNNENSDEPVTFQEELLLKGFARVAEWSAPRTKYVNRLRKAESAAKGKKLRIWEGYTEPAATLKSEDEHGFSARVIEVLSGDTVRIRDERGVEDRISLSSIRAQRFAGKDKESEPWAFEGKDQLRKSVVGKTVTVRVDYRRQLKRTVTQTKPDPNNPKQTQKVQVEVTEERRFCTLLVGNKSVAVELVKAGYASVIKHKSGEERSISYDQLMLAENDAKKKNKGIWGPKKNAPVHRVNDITQDTVGKTQKYLVSLKDKKVKGVIERVFTGTRFKVLLPKDSLLITFAISGIQTPSLRPRDESQPKPFAQEAINFSIESLMMRDVELEVKNIDKIGSFVGDLYVNGENFAVTILKNGYGLLQHKIAEKLANYEQLKDAESQAKDAKKNVWSVDPSVYRPKKLREQEEKDVTLSTRFKVVKGTPILVRVTEVLSATHFYFQRADSVKDIERVDELLSALNPSELEKGPVTEGDIVLALFAADDAWYRGKVVKYNKDKQEATILYIDYGSSETISNAHIRPLPKDSEIVKIKPTAVEAKLAFINLHAENYVDEAKLYFCELTSDRDLEAVVEFVDGGVQFVSLVDKSDNTSINQTLVRNGLAFVDSYYKKNDQFKSIMEVYEREQNIAKDERSYLWEDGAVYLSDDDLDF
jgi:staphylococcal nuclease domain-containing protein 1